MTEKPLFIPLKSEYYEAFAAGKKTSELRRGSDPKWSSKHCRIGRPVTLSKGYGKQNRLSGKVVNYTYMPAHMLPPNDYKAFIDCFGPSEEFVSVIRIEVDQ